MHQLDRIINHFPTASNPPAEMGFAYNASGSMRAVAVHMQDGVDTTERYTYNEHQHMTGYANFSTGQYAHYVYDHAGERVVKGTLGTSFASVNGQSGPLSLELDPLTLYVNPYFVSVFNSATPEVSKHYYMGAQRVATNLGAYLPGQSDPGGGSGNRNSATTQGVFMQSLQKTLQDLQVPGADKVKLSTFEEENSDSSMTRKSGGPIISFTRFTYYYHPDYLGHVEYITDNLGIPYQYFWYSPCSRRDYEVKPAGRRATLARPSPESAAIREGESFKEQIATNQPHGFTSPYRFNGKELDQESGLYYYGARYYNPTISTWLVVDPLAHEYPNFSAYAFTGNNPIMLVDPDGRRIETYELNSENGQIVEIDKTKYYKEKDGSITVVKEGETYDGESKTEVDKLQSDKNPDKAIFITGGRLKQSKKMRTFGDNQSFTGYEMSSEEEAKEFFEFTASNSDVEWDNSKYKKTDDDRERYYVTTSHNYRKSRGMSYLDKLGYKVLASDHSHPGNTADIVSETEAKRQSKLSGKNRNIPTRIFLPHQQKYEHY